MTNELPPLPMPDKQGCEDDPMYGIQPVDYYTAEQMQEYARAAIAQAHKPLTTDQVMKTCNANGSSGLIVKIARAVEAAHGIKGGEQ